MTEFRITERPWVSLAEFLTAAKKALKELLLSSDDRKAKSTLQIVTGNESCDLDSFASSLIYAYLSSSSSSATTSSTPPAVDIKIPLLPIPREDLSLRPEFLCVLSAINLPAEKLIFLDDFASGFTPSQPFPEKLRNSSTVFSLVDHNLLHPNFSSPPEGKDDESRVRGIIDHHVDEGKHVHSDPRIIVTPCGSCSSLVINYFSSRGVWPESGKEIIRQTSILALSAILIDTANVTRKVTPHDTKAVTFLEAQLEHSNVEKWDRDSFYKKLAQAKSDIGFLSLRDIFRKDYKEWTGGSSPSLKLGISSTVKSLEYLVSKGDEGEKASKREGGKPAFENVARKWVKEKNVDVWGLMTSFTTPEDGKYHRQLLLYVPADKDDYVKNVVERLVKRGNEEGFGFEEIDIGLVKNGEEGEPQGEIWKAYNQENLQMSRKQVAPLLRSCL